MRLEDELNDLNKIQEIIGTPSVNYDLIASICGRWLATGTFRSVFDYNLDEKYVVKIEHDNTSCNLVEYMVWDEVKYLNGNLAWVKDWFAPVRWISPNGRIMIMQKTFDRPSKKKPEKVPAFLWDVKQDNFGWIGKNYVCHDYGQFYNMIHYPKKFKKVDWEKLSRAY